MACQKSCFVFVYSDLIEIVSTIFNPSVVNLYGTGSTSISNLTCWTLTMTLGSPIRRALHGAQIAVRAA
uniref:Uncharacterized protein n=1 Tax=Pararge aegeria TaxID=116150 RepID=S4NX25_9NEOP